MASSANPSQLSRRLTSGLRSTVALGLSGINISLPVLLLTAAILAQGDRSLAQTPFEDAAPAAASTAENREAFANRMERIRAEIRQEQNKELDSDFQREIGDPSPNNPGSFANPGLRPSLNDGDLRLPRPTNVSNPPSLPRPDNLPSPRPTIVPPPPISQPAPIGRPAPALQPGFQSQKFGRYRLGPGDVLFVNVQRFPNLNLQGPVNPEGAIVLNLAGAVQVEGLTVAQAQERIRVALDRYVVNPNVDLSILSQRPVRVTLTGKVASPGYYPLNSPNISEALRLAGGTQSSADLRRVTVKRTLNNGRTITQQLDLYTPLVTGSNPPDLQLEDGDVIEVPQLTAADAQTYNRAFVSNSTLASQQPVQVTVVGEVSRPGFYVLQTGRVAEAILSAGGSLTSANLREVVVRRSLSNGAIASERVDLYSPLTTGTPLPDVYLEEGDIVEIPQLTVADAQTYDRSSIASSTLASQQPVQVTVIGEVSRPGFYVLQTGRVSEALLVAGGSLNSADLRAVEVRRSLRDGVIASEQVDLYSPLAAGTPLPKVRLEEGNIVSVPKLTDVDVADYDRTLIAKSTLSKPDIRVRLLSYAAGGATTLTLPSGSTFRDALNGVPLDAANLRSVALVRYDPETGQAVPLEINGKDALLGNPNADVPLRDNDVVVVGRNVVSKISFALNTFTQPFRDVLGFLLFFDSISDSASNLFRPSNR